MLKILCYNLYKDNDKYHCVNLLKPIFAIHLIYLQDNQLRGISEYPQKYRFDICCVSLRGAQQTKRGFYGFPLTTYIS